MTTESPGVDREAVTRQYATDEKLNIRYQIHEQYTLPKTDFAEWVISRVDWRGDEWVLDLGAGPGRYFDLVKQRIPNGRHFAGDLSFGMNMRQQQRNTDQRTGLANLDAQTLPFADNCLDVVLANHMLYHVPDLDKTLAEIQRVLKPTGLLIAATNSINNMPELTTLYRRALLVLTDFHYEDNRANRVKDHFELENGLAILSRHFYAAARYDHPSALVFPEAKPVTDYLNSMRDLRESALPEGITWDAYMDIMTQQVTRLIEHTGNLVVKKLAGAFVATNAGGFVGEYVAMNQNQNH